MTVQQIIDKAYKIIGDSERVYWTQDEMLGWVNEGLRLFARKTSFFRKTVEKALYEYSGDHDIALEGDVLRILEIYDSNNDIDFQIRPFSFKYLDTNDRDVAVVKDYNEVTIPQPTYSGVTVLEELEFDGEPLDLDGELLTIDMQRSEQVLDIIYTYIPEPVSLLSDEIPLPDFVAEALVYYVVSRAYLVDRAGQNVQKAMFYTKLFEDIVKQVREDSFRTFSGEPVQIDYQGF